MARNLFAVPGTAGNLCNCEQPPIGWTRRARCLFLGLMTRPLFLMSRFRYNGRGETGIESSAIRNSCHSIRWSPFRRRIITGRLRVFPFLLEFDQETVRSLRRPLMRVNYSHLD